MPGQLPQDNGLTPTQRKAAILGGGALFLGTPLGAAIAGPNRDFGYAKSKDGIIGRSAQGFADGYDNYARVRGTATPRGSLWAGVKAGTKEFGAGLGEAAYSKAGMFRLKEYEMGIGSAKGTIKIPKMNTAWATGIGAVGLGVGAAKGVYDGYRELQAGSVSYYGNAPAMDYDASTNIDRVSGARTFGADGQLVFGLHAGR